MRTHKLRTQSLSILLAGLIAAFALAACGSSSSDKSSGSSASGGGTTTSASSGDQVTIKNFKFGPDNLSVAKGTTVTFTNNDTANHTATATGANAFDTGTLNQGATKTVTLDKPGTYSYMCSFHPFMHGTITVK